MVRGFTRKQVLRESAPNTADLERKDSKRMTAGNGHDGQAAGSRVRTAVVVVMLPMAMCHDM